MKITRKDAIELLTAVGFLTAGTWNSKRLTAKLGKLPSAIDEEFEFEEDTSADVVSALDAIEAAVEADEEITIVKAYKDGQDDWKASFGEDEEEEEESEEESEEEEEEEEEEAPAPKKKSKKKSKKKAPEAPVDEDEEEEEEEEAPAPKKKSKKKASADKPAKKGKAVDRFGNRVPSQAADINVCLSKKFKSEEAIMEETELSKARVRCHLKYLEKRGIIELSKDNKAKVI